MSRNKKRRSAHASLPYGRSVIISCALLVVVMIGLAALADPWSSEIRAWQACLLLAAFPVSVVAVFYAEFRARHKHPAASGKAIRRAA
jgi:hypothetical protein